MRRKYGVSYKGSKSKIVDKLAEVIPYRGIDNFYDLFAGGCAVTHKMYLEGRYKHYYANDIDGQALRLFCDGLKGKYANETRWISREDFFNLKDCDPYVSCCWSFGNNQRDYLYSRAIEPYKKACHYAIVFGDFALLKDLYPDVGAACEITLNGIVDIHERRIKFRSVIGCKLSERSNSGLLRLSQANDVDRLESLERLERLQNLENLESYINSSSQDYSEIKIKQNSVIYCDIPYEATETYFKQKFDYSRFYDWCCKQTEPLFISSYNISDPRFKCVSEFEHRSTLNDKSNNKVIELVYMPITEATERFISSKKRKAVFTADDMFSWE